jgi:hypothetical protein
MVGSMKNGECGRIRNEAVMASSRYYSGAYLERLRTITETIPIRIIGFCSYNMLTFNLHINVITASP